MTLNFKLTNIISNFIYILTFVLILTLSCLKSSIASTNTNTDIAHTSSNIILKKHLYAPKAYNSYEYKALFSATNWWQHIKKDYVNFYTPPNLYYFLGTVSIGAGFAFTHADQYIANDWQTHIRSPFTNRVSNIAVLAGYLSFALTYIAALGLNALMPSLPYSSTIGLWATNTIRAGLVGLPLVGLFEAGLGGNRPSDPNPSSRWKLGKSGHAMSGHAFGGALPFLTAAMMTDNLALKYTLYAASTLTGLSRINGNQHYFSQVFMGWMTAYLAVSSVMRTNHQFIQNHNLAIYPIALPNGMGIGITQNIN